MADKKQKEQDEMSLIECNKYMLENQINTDVTFLVGETQQEVKAHKYVLGSRNTVFDAMFFGSLAEKGEIIIPDIELSVFKSLMNYFYTDEMKVTEDNVCDLMYASSKYNAKGVMKKCTDFLETSICDNVCQVLENAVLYNEADLEAKCMTFIFNRAEDILHTESFNELSSRSLKLIIESDELRVEESLIYKSVIAWAEHNCAKQFPVTEENIMAVLGELIYLVRFPLMPAQYFAEEVVPRKILPDVDIKEISMYINGSKKTISNEKIVTKSRKPLLQSVYRMSTSAIALSHLNKAEKIKICVSKEIFLHGLIMFGCLDESSTLDCKLSLGKTVLSTCSEIVPSTKGSGTLKVFLPSPIQLLPENEYTLNVPLLGKVSCGICQSVDIKIYDIKISFSQYSKDVYPLESQVCGLILSRKT